MGTRRPSLMVLTSMKCLAVEQPPLRTPAITHATSHSNSNATQRAERVRHAEDRAGDFWFRTSAPHAVIAVPASRHGASASRRI
jgi:hypothetical protein